VYFVKINNQQEQSKKAVKVYLSLTLGVCFLFGVLAFILPGETGDSVFDLLAKIFTPIPVLATLLTRKIIKDKSSWNLDIRVWRNTKALLLSTFLPGFSVLLGAIVYYAAYPQELHANVQALFGFCSQYGLPDNIPVNNVSIAITAIILWLVSALAIPIHFLELGEEIGWRGYLLPKQLSYMSVKKAVLTNGTLWGIAHAPLIFFGFNYGMDYLGAPFTGILLMIVFCISAEICMSYSMVKTNNCMYAAIIHGAINVAADLQILSVAVNRPLIGPSPTGIIGMGVIVIIAVYIFFWKLKTPTK
jgi:membrane protease YdiL (CAAX protease family)